MNGTQCSFTPHKARNECACIGQEERKDRHEDVPEVFVFGQGKPLHFFDMLQSYRPYGADASGPAVLFTSGSLYSSGEQSPEQTGLRTPPAMVAMTQDDPLPKAEDFKCSFNPSPKPNSPEPLFNGLQSLPPGVGPEQTYIPGEHFDADSGSDVDFLLIPSSQSSPGFQAHGFKLPV